METNISPLWGTLGGSSPNSTTEKLIFEFLVAIWVWAAPGLLLAGQSGAVVVVTYNVENFHIRPFGNRPLKSTESRARVAETLLAIHPDVIAFQEMGEAVALDSLQMALKSGGLDLPFRDHLGGHDTNIFVALLSRVPIVAQHDHTNDSFVLDGRRFHSSRSTIEAEFEISPEFRFTLLTTHLKSKRPVAYADEAELREQEARLLRRHVDDLLRQDPQVNLLVCGDFNDTPDSKPIHLLIGSGRQALFDTRPFEATAGVPNDASERNKKERQITWTHFYPHDDTYSRFDYQLLSRSMTRHWIPEQSYVYAWPHWGEASDHRPVVCTFRFNPP